MRWKHRPAYRMSLSEVAVSEMRAAANSAHPLETGGLLIGYRRNELIVVVDVVEVRDVASTSHGYTRREQAAQVVLDTARTRWGGTFGYVGDWHSHTALVAPSSRDIRSLRRVARQYRLPVGLIVVARRTAMASRLFAVVAHGRRLARLEDTAIAVLEDADHRMPPSEQERDTYD